MPRYFLAIPLPDKVRDCLVAVQPPAFPGLRLVGRQEMHLTLHFLGEIAPRWEEVMREALARVKMNAFTITIRGVGRFPSEGQPQVLWSGVDSSPSLHALHHTIGTALKDATGFQPEVRLYSPHISLARLNTPVPPVVIENYLEEHKGFQIPCVLLKHFALYSSAFIDNVPQYREEALFQLSEPYCQLE